MKKLLFTNLSYTTMKNILTLIFALFSLVANSQRLAHHTSNLPSLIVNQITVNGGDVYLATNDGVAKFDSAVTAIQGVTGKVYSVAYSQNTLYIGQDNKVGYYNYIDSTWLFVGAYGNINNIVPVEGYPTMAISDKGLQYGYNRTNNFGVIDGSPTGSRSGIVKYYENGIEYIFYTNFTNLIQFNVKEHIFTNLGPSTLLAISHANGIIYYARIGGIGKYEIATGAYQNLIPITGLKTLAADDSNGDVWVALNDGKIKKYDPTTNTFSYEIEIGSTINDLKAVNGKVYIGTNNGLYVFDCTASPEIATVTNNGTSATLETVAISTASYQWYYSEVDPATLRITAGLPFTPIDGANSNTYHATVSGYYLVEITNNNTVSQSEVLHVQLNNPTDNSNVTSIFDSNVNIDAIQAYPNPFSDVINLKSPYTINKVIVRDINGNNQSFNISGSDIQINPIMKGLLFLEIHTNNGIFTQKIIQK